MSTGKTIAIVLVIAVSCGVLMVASCGGLLFLGYRSANTSVTPEIDRLFAAMEGGRFAGTYETDTTQEFRQITSKEQYADIGKAISLRLGPLKNKSMKSFNLRAVNTNSFADVSYDATFEKGSGTIVAKLRREEGKWKFVSFQVNSPVFQQELATEKCANCGAPHPRSARFCSACGAAIGASETTKNEPAKAEVEK
jgi:hypothetical protein